ncbi:hypothetical protein BDR05DRAFT_537983 [Suillus weaverae]|nr:hypothetical protein BDR05DRAFT_537983 [Suillus weaverae]
MSQDTNRPTLTVAILLLILSTAHTVVNITRVKDGLVKYRDTFRGGTASFFEDASRPTYLIKNALNIMQTLLAELW